MLERPPFVATALCGLIWSGCGSGSDDGGAFAGANAVSGLGSQTSGTSGEGDAESKETPAIGHPTIADVDTIERLLADTARSSPGGKVVYVARVPATSAAPDSAVMRHLINRLGGFKQHCSAYHGIIEGNGFGVAMKRGVITTFLQLSQTRSRVFVHARVGSLLKAASDQGLTQVHSVLEEAQRRGLLGEKPPEPLAVH